MSELDYSTVSVKKFLLNKLTKEFLNGKGYRSRSDFASDAIRRLLTELEGR